MARLSCTPRCRRLPGRAQRGERGSCSSLSRAADRVLADSGRDRGGPRSRTRIRDHAEHGRDTSGGCLGQRGGGAPMTVVVAIVGLIFLILVHELGHMLTAKALGVRVPEFAIGLGPPIFKKKLGATTYSFRIILLGGFAKMAGMN